MSSNVTADDIPMGNDSAQVLHGACASACASYEDGLITVMENIDHFFLLLMGTIILLMQV